MKKQLSQFCLMMLAAFTLMSSSCKKNTGEENDAEVITTMQLTFVPQGGGATVTYKYDDPDGPGGIAATKDQIVLSANKIYNVAVQLLNKTVTPNVDVTLEVAAEPLAHRFYYQPSSGSNITITGLNNDPAGIPLGITSLWTTGAAAMGTVKVTLRHYPGNPPGKAATDAADSPKSSTDVEVEFATRVQ